MITGTLLLLTCLTLSAQRFFNLTADEVRIDSVLPVFNYTYPIGSRYADSVFTVRQRVYYKESDVWAFIRKNKKDKGGQLSEKIDQMKRPSWK